MEPLLSIPCAANRYQVEHMERLRRAFHALTGRDLIDPALSPDAAAEALFHAPFVVLSHDAAPDPLPTYGYQTALKLFALSWEQLTQMPSRLTAEVPNQAERARFLAEVARQGFMGDSSGIRMSRSRPRFLIQQATVGNPTDNSNRFIGQVTTFHQRQCLEKGESLPQSSRHFDEA